MIHPPGSSHPPIMLDLMKDGQPVTVSVPYDLLTVFVRQFLASALPPTAQVEDRMREHISFSSDNPIFEIAKADDGRIICTFLSRGMRPWQIILPRDRADLLCRELAEQLGITVS